MKIAKPLFSQSGVAAVEMALVLLFLVQLLLGIVDFGRWLHAVNSAGEATRYGARTAVVCDNSLAGRAAARARMAFFLPAGTPVTSINIQPISGAASGCAAGEVCAVSVSITGVTIPAIAWFLPAQLPIPNQTVVLPRESFSSTINASSNPACF
jgi:Flp pilus assembly protein TadG